MKPPAFSVPVYALNSPLELPIYLLLAVLCALGAVFFIRVLYAAEHHFDKLPIALPYRTMIGMLLTGIVALAYPQVLGPGLEFIGSSIANDISLSLGFIAGLVLAKLLATTFTLGAGNSGGVFAPALFMGAMLGAVIGQVGHQFWPGVVAHPGAFALVGMASLFAGAARSPITAIIIVLEMSNDYRLILPLLMTVVVTTLLSDLLYSDSIYTRKLKLRGIQLQSGQDIDLLQSVNVDEVMSSDDITLAPGMPMAEAIPYFQNTHHNGFPIVDGRNALRGIITLTDIEKAQEAQLAETTPIAQIGSNENVITVYPDDPIYLALRRMNVYGIGRLPVVSREDSSIYLGMIRRANVLKAYDIALQRKAEEQHRQKYLKLRDMQTTTFIEVVVEPGAPMVGLTLSEFPYSESCLLVSVWHDGSMRIAHGSTKIAAGDRIVAFADQVMKHRIREQFVLPASTDT